MNETTENGSANAADALGAISNQAFRQKAFLQRIALRFGVPPWSLYAALLAGAVVLGYLAYLAVVQIRNDIPVAILMPDPNQVLSVRPQRIGFDGAWLDGHAAATSGFPHVEHYPFPLPSLDTIEKQFEELYDKGFRYFIVTMSDTVLKLTDGGSGSAWTKFLGRHPIDPPILIATVASAPLPDGAVVRRGVIRNYIRSDDEVNQFAAYIDSRGLDPNTTEVFVLYIRDRYGDKAHDLIVEKIRPRAKKTIGIDANANADDFDRVFSDLKDEIDDQKYAFVILVGYGDMVVGMLDVLNNAARVYPNRVDEVLVVSTLTEKDWQPAFYKQTGGQFIPRITTLAPFATGGEEGSGRFKDCDGGAVCQFSYMTLSIVLKCAAERGSEDFLDCFVRRKEEDGFPDIEVSATGDSIVPLRVIVIEK